MSLRGWKKIISKLRLEQRRCCCFVVHLYESLNIDKKESSLCDMKKNYFLSSFVNPERWKKKSLRNNSHCECKVMQWKGFFVVVVVWWKFYKSSQGFQFSVNHFLQLSQQFSFERDDFILRIGEIFICCDFLIY